MRRLPAPTVNANGNVIGRKRKEPPKDAAKRIEKLARDGANQVGIAAALNIGDELFRYWLDDYPALKQAFDRGRERERQILHSTLRQIANDRSHRDCAIASMFLLKSRHQYVEGDQSGAGNRVAITFNLPAALPKNVYDAVVNRELDTTPD